MRTKNNFKRLLGSVRSKHRAVGLAIASQLLSYITLPIDFIASFFISKRKSLPDDSPRVIVIVSPPRAGSTIVYQILARALPVSYISNLHSMFPSLAQRMLNRTKLGTGFNNYYGHTSSLHDVSEGNEFIDPLFKGNPDIKTIRKRFIKLLDKLNPNGDMFIIKNTRNYKNAAKLYKAFPQISFVRIRRDIVSIILSELRAYYELGGFHPVPDCLKNDSTTDPVEFVVKQVSTIEKEIDQQFKEIPNSNCFEIEYEDFCANPKTNITKFASDFLNLDVLELNYDVLNFPLKASKRNRHNSPEYDRILELLNRNSSVRG